MRPHLTSGNFFDTGLIWVLAACLIVTASLAHSQTLVSTGQSAACSECGIVESVTEVPRDTPNSGVGAAIGAAIGGLIANKIGGEEGKTMATIIGLLGGVWAGNAIEKQLKQKPGYRIVVRMLDHTQRTFEQEAALPVGAQVRVQAGTLVLIERESTAEST
jgi:outer membrane lipoprotein SlyB